ncbi:MAG: replication-associated recombination protein A [Sutterellaceae bacterium]|nr:replication-associated recombination protein A [Sutterellaceae bacterium]MDD7441552.1 replication-associated recombination protein A [Sutterellaceae bacterium]MDY2867281.1 replication-associated recombination protein A [Mesosutterella sp.]
MTADLFGDAGIGVARTKPSTDRPVRAEKPPLAERLRPRTIDDVIGQKHLLGPGMPLRTAFESGHPHSMILWGPPGVGKTTLARLMADAFGLPFVTISAVLAGVKDIRETVEAAKAHMQATGEPTVVFVDEVHRFNKAQQDAFLPHVESGLFIFIGATTENPSFEVNNALLSRATVYTLEALSPDDMKQLLERGLKLAYPDLKVTPEAAELFASLADGDARRLLNALEVSAEMAAARNVSEIDAEFLKKSIPAAQRRFDKGGDFFYDQISALHKSVRGSDPDAALYWLCRMLDGGCDPRYICRRVMRMAVEDIGLADPRGTQLALEAAEIYERLGSPEGELAIAQAVVYLAVAAKSNSVEVAYNEVRRFVKQDRTRPVPLYLRNAPTKLMSKLGYGDGYRYAHDEPGAFAAGEIYLPEGLEGMRWYKPNPRGLEIKIGEKLERLKEMNEAAWAEGKGRKRKT